METVVVISHKHKKDANVSADGTSKVGTSEGNNATGAEAQLNELKPKKPIEHESDVNRIVDSQDNEYVLSKSK